MNTGEYIYRTVGLVKYGELCHRNRDETLEPFFISVTQVLLLI